MTRHLLHTDHGFLDALLGLFMELGHSGAQFPCAVKTYRAQNKTKHVRTSAYLHVVTCQKLCISTDFYMGIGQMTLFVSLKKAVELGFSSKMARHVCWDAQCLVLVYVCNMPMADLGLMMGSHPR